MVNKHSTGGESRVRAAIEALRAGRMVVLVDDEDRENEGDLVLAAERVTADAVNFMATKARGLICLALTEAQVRALRLPLMVAQNTSSRGTAFTVSIEASTGVSTGISAQDRAHTIRTAVNPNAGPGDLVSPGHVFPLQARPGGVLQRSGHTEGAVDLARLAGLHPSAVICEIMNEDGTMARRPDLERYAEEHALPLLTVAELIAYRLEQERIVEPYHEGKVDLPGVDGKHRTWSTTVFRSTVDGQEMLALCLGDASPEPTLVRVHTTSLFGDILNIPAPGRAPFSQARAQIEAAGRGVLLLIPGSTHPSKDACRFGLQPLSSSQDEPARAREQADVIREYGLGAQALSALGLRDLRILTNRPRALPNLEAFGVRVVEQVAFEASASEKAV